MVMGDEMSSGLSYEWTAPKGTNVHTRQNSAPDVKDRAMLCRSTKCQARNGFQARSH